MPYFTFCTRDMDIHFKVTYTSYSSYQIKNVHMNELYKIMKRIDFCPHQMSRNINRRFNPRIILSYTQLFWEIKYELR